MPRVLLVDGDIYIYQIAAACQKAAIDWGDGIFSPEIADLKEAAGRFDSRLDEMKQTFGADQVVIALKDRDNWRKKILPTYKANRRAAVRPMLIGPLMEYAKEHYRVYQRPTLEGDDILGILATSTKIIPGEKVIVSLDKDLKTIPGLHGSEDGTVREIEQAEADHMHLVQTLTGDPVDGYSGCPGIGPKKAKDLLGGAVNPRDAWKIIEAAYIKAGLSADVALTMARVARICRASDYDFKRKEVILWQPPK